MVIIPSHFQIANKYAKFKLMQDQLKQTIDALINRGVDESKAKAEPAKTYQLYLTLLIEKATPLLSEKDLEEFEIKDADSNETKIAKFNKLSQLALPMIEQLTHDQVTEIINDLNQQL